MEWWILAICMSLAGTSLAGFGLCIQKYAHQRMQDDEGESPNTRQSRDCTCPRYCLSKWWLAGMSVFMCGHVLCFLALGWGTQSVLSCVNCWSMVVTFVIAPVLLGETVSIFRMCSVLVLVFGCVWVIIFGPRKYREYNVEALREGWSIFTVQMCSLLCAAVLLYLVIRAMITTKRPRITVFQATLTAAMLGWYSVLTAKCTAGLLWTTVYHQNNQLDSVESWMAITAVVILGLTNVHCLNLALQLGDAVFVIPLYEALSVTGQIFIGGIFFDEFSELTPEKHIYFWIGVACVVSGVVAISSAGPKIPVLQMAFLSPPDGTSSIPTPRLMGGGTPPKEKEAEAAKLTEGKPHGSYHSA